MFGTFESQIQRLEIVCDNYSGIFQAGQEIYGKVVIEVDNEKSVEELSLRCVGKANVEWTETDFGKESKREIITHIKTDSYSSEEIYFENTQWLLKKADGSESWLPPGKSELDFVIQLPQSIPSSFRGEFGSVKYFLQATLKSSSCPNRDVQFILNIKGHLDLNDLEESPEDSEGRIVNMTREITVGFFCCTGGPIGFHFNMMNLFYVPGDYINFTAEVFNLSKLQEYFIFAILTEADDQTKEIYHEILRLKGPELVPHCNESWAGDLMPIPPHLPPTNLGGCEIITLQYSLKIEIKRMEDVILGAEQEITIGTVPRLLKNEENTPSRISKTDSGVTFNTSGS